MSELFAATTNVPPAPSVSGPPVEFPVTASRAVTFSNRTPAAVVSGAPNVRSPPPDTIEPAPRFTFQFVVTGVPGVTCRPGVSVGTVRASVMNSDNGATPSRTSTPVPVTRVPATVTGAIADSASGCVMRSDPANTTVSCE